MCVYFRLLDLEKTAIKTLGRFPDLLRKERPSRLLQTVVWKKCFYFTKASSGHCSGFTPIPLYDETGWFYVITKTGAKYELAHINKNISRLMFFNKLYKRSL